MLSFMYRSLIIVNVLACIVNLVWGDVVLVFPHFILAASLLYYDTEF